jgi:2-C-methyl-D-erythritol 4-phosphate cytidylyltransferase/2-C-methyl-D-erythritol 2,4-cyclodiphosphate synthase
MRVMALLVAGGAGVRLGGAVPKQYLPLLGRAVIRHAAEALLRDGQVEAVLPVVAAGEQARVSGLLEGLAVRPAVVGGATRQASVRAGLEALAADPPDVVLVHDAARPVVRTGPWLRCCRRSASTPGPSRPARGGHHQGCGGWADRPHGAPRGAVPGADPQAFRFDVLLEAHRRATGEVTDDAALLEAAGLPVAIVPGAEDNLKITYPGDVERVAAAMLPRLLPRMGTGFDVHRLVPGRPLWLCGVEVPHELGLAGPFGCRCRPARALRRDLRGPGRGRHRPALPTLGDAVEGRGTAAPSSCTRRVGWPHGAACSATRM